MSRSDERQGPPPTIDNTTFALLDSMVNADAHWTCLSGVCPKSARRPALWVGWWVIPDTGRATDKTPTPGPTQQWWPGVAASPGGEPMARPGVQPRPSPLTDPPPREPPPRRPHRAIPDDFTVRVPNALTATCPVCGALVEVELADQHRDYHQRLAQLRGQVFQLRDQAAALDARVTALENPPPPP